MPLPRKATPFTHKWLQCKQAPHPRPLTVCAFLPCTAALSSLQGHALWLQGKERALVQGRLGHYAGCVFHRTGPAPPALQDHSMWLQAQGRALLHEYPSAAHSTQQQRE